MIHSLCGFDDVPGAVVIHVVLTTNSLTVAMVVMTLGFDFLEKEQIETHRLSGYQSMNKYDKNQDLFTEQMKIHGTRWTSFERQH